MDYILISKLLFVFFLIFIYYKIIKDFIYRISPAIAMSLPILSKYPTVKATGVIEILLIASSHLVFCLSLIYLFKLSWEQLGLNNINLIELMYGILLGIAMLAITTLLCRFFMIFLKRIFPKHLPKDIKSWVTLARGGWMRHHLHNFQILPIYLALVTLILQISSEEIIFRGVLLNYFINYDPLLAIIISTVLFVFMQSFQTPNWIVAMFPMVGSLVSGIFFSAVYLKTKGLVSLITAHCVFFLLAAL